MNQASKKFRWIVLIGLQIMLYIILPPAHAEAHQPYFEDSEFTYNAPWPVPDAMISTAVYATLSTATDVDYFTFEGRAGQSVLLAMSIPQIQGQDYFAPSIALLGADLPAATLPAQIQYPAGHGAVIVADAGGEAPTFFEPFSRTRYWRRQRQYVTLPATATYLVALWSPNGALGRYTFVIGDREVRGGDPAFSTKMGSYWQPVPQPTRALPTSTPTLIPTQIPTNTPLPTLTPRPTNTQVPTAMPISTNTPVPSPTATLLPTATSTPFVSSNRLLTPNPTIADHTATLGTERPTLPQPLRPAYGPN